MPAEHTGVRSIRVAVALAALSTATAVHAQSSRTLYVDQVALSGGDGQTWWSAFQDIQQALDAVRLDPPTGTEFVRIRIAQGVYKPDRGTGDRSLSFSLPARVGLTGGFGGLRAPNPNIQIFETILSGDLAGDDGPNFINRTDNSIHVVTIEPRTDTTPLNSGVTYFADAELWNLTIERGHADVSTTNQGRDGGGVLVRNSGPISIEHCTFRHNYAENYGGALNLWATDVANISNSQFLQNKSLYDGGGLYTRARTLRLWSCIFRGNTSESSGGGLACGQAELSNCEFDLNSGEYAGGASMFSGTVTACVFGANSSAFGPGALQANRTTIDSSSFLHNSGRTASAVTLSQSRMANCTVVKNACTVTGGSAVDADNLSSIVNCILWQNTGTNSAQAKCNTVTTSVVSGGTAGIRHSGGVLTDILAADPAFVNPTGTSTSPNSYKDKDYRLSAASPCIDRGRPVPDVHGYPEASYDYYSNAERRLVNSTCTAAAIVDIGAREYQLYNCPLPIPVLYVNASAPPGGNGRTWQTAFRDLQDALDTPGVTGVWIAAGTYRPGRNTLDRNSRFLIAKDGVTLVGGFAGFETTLAQRQLGTNHSILSGDLLGNDSDAEFTKLDNAKSLLSVTGVDFQFVLDGLSFTRAYSTAGDNFFGGVVAGLSTDVMFKNCIFDGNVAASDPAKPTSSASVVWLSAYFGNSSAFDNCSFTRNVVRSDGGVATLYGVVTMDGCSVSGNTVYGRAGAINCDGYSSQSVTIKRSTFVGNTTIGPNALGAALRLAGGQVIGCRFLGNAVFATESNGVPTSAAGGAVSFTSGNGPPLLLNCEFSGNKAIGSNAVGSAVSASGLDVINCTFANNVAAATVTAPISGPSIFTSSWRVAMFNSILSTPPGTTVPQIGGSSWSSIVDRCIGNTDVDIIADPRFVNPLGADGVAGTLDDDLSLKSDSPAIDRADSSVFPSSITTDVIGRNRLFDAPATANSGIGTIRYLDIGAHEFDGRACAADFDASGTVLPADIFAFLNAWFAGQIQADTDRSGTITPADIFVFLNTWFAGC